MYEGSLVRWESICNLPSHGSFMPLTDKLRCNCHLGCHVDTTPMCWGSITNTRQVSGITGANTPKEKSLKGFPRLPGTPSRSLHFSLKIFIHFCHYITLDKILLNPAHANSHIFNCQLYRNTSKIMPKYYNCNKTPDSAKV